MQEQFVTYEIALALKKLSFDEKCFAFYQAKYETDPITRRDLITYPKLSAFHQTYLDEIEGFRYSELDLDIYCDDLLAPLWQQVIDWFLKKKHLYIDITFKEVKGPKIEGINSVYFDIEIYSIFGGDAWKKYRFSEISDDYYYAREQAILKAIELCKDKKF